MGLQIVNTMEFRAFDGYVSATTESVSYEEIGALAHEIELETKGDIAPGVRVGGAGPYELIVVLSGAVTAAAAATTALCAVLNRWKAKNPDVEVTFVLDDWLTATFKGGSIDELPPEVRDRIAELLGNTDELPPNTKTPKELPGGPVDGTEDDAGPTTPSSS